MSPDIAIRSSLDFYHHLTEYDDKILIAFFLALIVPCLYPMFLTLRTCALGLATAVQVSQVDVRSM